MSVQEDLKAIEAGLERRDAEIARLRAEVERWRNECYLYAGHSAVDNAQRLLDSLAARDRVIEAAFKALDLHEEAYLGHTSDCGSWDGTTATACDCGWLDAHSLSCEARRLLSLIEWRDRLRELCK